MKIVEIRLLETAEAAKTPYIEARVYPPIAKLMGISHKDTVSIKPTPTGIELAVLPTYSQLTGYKAHADHCGVMKVSSRNLVGKGILAGTYKHVGSRFCKTLNVEWHEFSIN